MILFFLYPKNRIHLAPAKAIRFSLSISRLLRHQEPTGLAFPGTLTQQSRVQVVATSHWEHSSVESPKAPMPLRPGQTPEM